MTTIEIQVPDEIAQNAVRRAKGRKQSLSEYIKSLVVADGGFADVDVTLQDVVNRIVALGPNTGSVVMPSGTTAGFQSNHETATGNWQDWQRAWDEFEAMNKLADSAP